MRTPPGPTKSAPGSAWGFEARGTLELTSVGHDIIRRHILSWQMGPMPSMQPRISSCSKGGKTCVLALVSHGKLRAVPMGNLGDDGRGSSAKPTLATALLVLQSFGSLVAPPSEGLLKSALAIAAMFRSGAEGSQRGVLPGLIEPTPAAAREDEMLEKTAEGGLDASDSSPESDGLPLDRSIGDASSADCSPAGLS